MGEPNEDLDPFLAATEGLGKGYGRAVHRLFEWAVLRRDQPVDRELDRISIRRMIEEECSDLRRSEQVNRMEQATSALASFRSSEHWQALMGADRVLTEVPFMHPEVSDGRIGVTAGFIDLAYRVNGAWYIVDYKTDVNPVEELRRHYQDQLAAYQRHWAAVTGEPVTRVDLWFTSAGAGSSTVPATEPATSPGAKIVDQTADGQLKLF